MWNSYNIFTFTILRHFRTVPMGTVCIFWFILALRNFLVGTVKKNTLYMEIFHPTCCCPGTSFAKAQLAWDISHLYKGYDVALVAVIEGRICATAMAEPTLLLPSALVSEPVSADIRFWMWLFERKLLLLFCRKWAISSSKFLIFVRASLSKAL